MIKILFEDDFILICEKTPGLLSEASEAPDSLPLILNSQTGCIVYPVHRLDRPAGGAIIYAKSKKAAAAFSSLVSEGKLSKKYLAVLEGIPQNSEGVLKDYLFKDSRKNKSYTVKKMRKGVKEAELFYKITASAENHSLAEITLKTGRTHQIRVQFASRGFPLAGGGQLDEASLKQIADLTAGRYFRAKDTAGLQKIYSEIDKLEPNDTEGRFIREIKELYYIPLLTAWGLALILAFSGRRRYHV